MNRRVAKIVVILIIVGLIGGFSLGTVLSVFAPDSRNAKTMNRSSIEEMKRNAKPVKK